MAAILGGGRYFQSAASVGPQTTLNFSTQCVLNLWARKHAKIQRSCPLRDILNVNLTKFHSEIASHALTTVSRKQTPFETALPYIVNACRFRLIFFITERPPRVHQSSCFCDVPSEMCFPYPGTHICSGEHISLWRHSDISSTVICIPLNSYPRYMFPG